MEGWPRGLPVECSCGAKSRYGGPNRSEYESLAMRHRLNQNVRETHETRVTKELM